MCLDSEDGQRALKGGPNLGGRLGRQERHCVNFTGLELPVDAVALMNPQLIGKKREGLPSLLRALRSHSGVPLGSS